MQKSMLSEIPDQSKDPVENVLRAVSQNVLVFIFGLLPLFFLPVSFVGLDFIKISVVIVGVLLSLIFFSLSVLRSGSFSFSAPWALWALWAVVLSTAVSAALSGDMRDAFLGDDLGVHTAAFVAVLALVVTVSLFILQSKEAITRLYIVLTGSAVILGLFHFIRLFFGPDMLSFGVFTNLVSTPLGGWNDLALFLGLCILLSLVVLEQVPLTKWGKGLFTLVVGISLFMLAVINFVAVWVVLGVVSIVVLMYGLTKDRFSEKTLSFGGKQNHVSVLSVTLCIAVFITSLVFFIGGGTVGSSISKVTGISYIEVRPSFEATMDVARHVFKENAFVGTGPNKFIDAWRLYKDPSINQTVFWATDFKGGNGYLTTFFATTGVLGIVAWAAFLGLFLFVGFRMLFRSATVDRLWYFIGSSAFAASTYLWGMSLLYVPGATILLLAALFTAIMFIAYGALLEEKKFSLSIINNRRAGFVLVAVVMIVIVSAASGLYFISKNYASVYEFGSAVYGAQTGLDIALVEERIASAYASSKNDAYASQLAAVQLAKMNSLAGLLELTTEQQQQLQLSVQNGINAALVATTDDPTDAVNWSTLGSIYSVLASASVEGAKDKALEAFAQARTYDPQNPLHILLEAQLYSRTGDLAQARVKAQEAIALKRNYTDALFFLTQLDIAEGKTESAIATTQAIISLEPNNPARYYQLGVLQSAAQNQDAAIAAFERAVSLDTNYANARYFLALSYAQKGNTEGAKAQLQKVLELNPGNADVTALIAQLESGQPLSVAPAATQPVAEPEAVSESESAVTTTEQPETSLISPVNSITEGSEQAEPQTAQ